MVGRKDHRLHIKQSVKGETTIDRTDRFWVERGVCVYVCVCVSVRGAFLQSCCGDRQGRVPPACPHADSFTNAVLHLNCCLG